MELQELRIDNLFKTQSYFDYESKIGKVTEIGKKQVHIGGKRIGLNELIPISITEDILLQSGFTHFNWLQDSSVFECRYFKCTLDDNGVNLFCDNLKNLKPVKYLHQFQNLYYDLTGEELEININYIKSTEKVFV